MSLQTPLQSPKGLGTVQGDTHAASLTGSNTQAAAISDNSASKVSNAGSAFFIAETTLVSSAAVTPTSAINVLQIVASFVGLKQNNAGTVTGRIKEGAVTLASITTASIGIGSYAGITLTYTTTNISVAAHTYSLTAQTSTDNFRTNIVDGTTESQSIKVNLYSASLTGSDTHAATLTGSAGTCQ